MNPNAAGVATSRDQNATAFERFVSADVDQFAERIRPLERRVMQLGTGVFQASIEAFVEGPVKIVRERYEPPLAMSGAPPDGTRSFALVTAATDSACFCARPIVVGEVAVTHPGEGWHVRTPRRCEWINVVVEVDALRARAEQLGLSDPERGLEGIAVLARPSLTRCLHAVHRSGPRDITALRSVSMRRRIADEVLTRVALGAAGEHDGVSARVPRSPVRHRAVSRVLAYLREVAPLAPTIPDLCRISGVGARTLEYAFRERFGVTPIRFLKLFRLSAAHRALQRTDASSPTVTEIATRHGFFDLGHFARDYRLLFGNSPGRVLRAARSPRADGVTPRVRADFS